MKHYPDTSNNPSLPEIEERVLARWKEQGAFKRSVENRPAAKDSKNNEWIFYDGPPFANGLPHYGHLLTSCIKDLFARYQTMKGSRVERRFGWDCHGLPAEMEAEKELGIQGQIAIKEYGIGKFNDACRASVMKYTHEWEYYVTRQARWVDFDNAYKTMDLPYMESVMWAFSRLHEKGLVYEGHKVMPYSWACETPLSNFETRMDNAYREREDRAVTVAFRLKDRPAGAPEADEYYLLAWTTTPWTLPSNLALAVKRDMDYACVLQEVPAEPLPPLAGGGRRGVSAHLAHGVGGAEFSTRDPASLERAKDLRKNATEAEKKLWGHLRGGRLAGYGFRRQHPVGPYIADFACLEEMLIIELDGGQHAEEPQKLHDEKRTAYLEEAGYRVLRFWNSEFFENEEGVVETILHALDTHISFPDTPTLTLPRKREREDAPPQGGSGRVCHVFAASTVGDGVQAEKIIKGAALLNLSYEPLFPYFKDTRNAFRVLEGDFIEEGSGTGIVHLAPGFGEDDQRVCEAAGIAVVCPVDEAGKYTGEIYGLPNLKLRGLNVVADTRKDADEPYKDEQLRKYGLANLRIITWLKEQGRLIKQEDIKHNYPHCWRTDTPLIYKAVPSWYVKVTAFRDRMAELNQRINWIPGHVRDGLFGKWLENAHDWAISRNRFWGAPIPVWKSKSGKMKVFGNIADLEKASGQKITDLHRPFIDGIIIHENGEEYRRVPEVLDCWFESGAMPFAQVHYPFENKEWFENHFPADFIVEYAAQTRGWFYTLMVLATALFDCAPFKHCICHGVILDSTGKKLSKRLRNYPDPKEVYSTFGADAMRWMLISGPVMHGGELLVSKDGEEIRDAVRLVIKPVWNAYHFFTLYANADGIKGRLIVDGWQLMEKAGPSTINHQPPTNIMDRYILAKLRRAVEGIGAALDGFDTPRACKETENFFEVLNNWYIRRCRERFWRESGADDADKQAAYDTLYTVLVTMCRACAPLLPLTLEEIYRGLTGKESVHLEDFPLPSSRAEQSDPRCIASSEPAVPPRNDGSPSGDSALMDAMDRARDACNAALAIRNAENIRIRQPLASLTLYGADARAMESCRDLIADEVNVKEVRFSEDLDKSATRKLQVNFPVAGKRLGAKMKDVAAAAKKGAWQDIGGGRVEIGGEVMEPGEFSLLLEPKAKKGAQALSGNDTLVVLDLAITPELRAEGITRDLVRAVQQARKEANLKITDRIALTVETDETIRGAVSIPANAEYLKEQTLAASLSFGPASGKKHRSEARLEDGAAIIAFDEVA